MWPCGNNIPFTGVTPYFQGPLYTSARAMRVTDVLLEEKVRGEGGSESVCVCECKGREKGQETKGRGEEEAVWELED